MGFRTYEDTKVNWLLARERAVCINLGKQNLSQDRGTTRHNSAHGRYGIVSFLGLFLWAPLLRRLTYKNRVTPVSTLIRRYVYAEVLWWSSYKCHLCTSYELLLLVSGRCQTVGSLMLKRKASRPRSQKIIILCNLLGLRKKSTNTAENSYFRNTKKFVMFPRKGPDAALSRCQYMAILCYSNKFSF